eukprot:c21096_g1_i1.p1 GENE.c21096_g1_i1~~c21096_g1_i1.p1  ORF type:complete len:173 (+),score=54.35 c21096_g1_i1:39-557(+)
MNDDDFEGDDPLLREQKEFLAKKQNPAAKVKISNDIRKIPRPHLNEKTKQPTQPTQPTQEKRTRISIFKQAMLQKNENLVEEKKIKIEIGVENSLHHHGLEPHRPGYTLFELLHLTRSQFPQQRTISLLTLSKILLNSKNNSLFPINSENKKNLLDLNENEKFKGRRRRNYF